VLRSRIIFLRPRIRERKIMRHQLRRIYSISFSNKNPKKYKFYFGSGSDSENTAAPVPQHSLDPAQQMFSFLQKSQKNPNIENI
jgi:hypothetical protein